MPDFKKALEKKRAAARIKPVIIEDHPWYRLLCVQDNLNIVLRQVYDHDKGKMFVYEYIDQTGFTGRPSTKFGKELTMPESQISDELEKNIFKIVNKQEPDKKVVIPTATAATLF